MASRSVTVRGWVAGADCARASSAEATVATTSDARNTRISLGLQAPGVPRANHRHRVARGVRLPGEIPCAMGTMPGAEQDKSASSRDLRGGARLAATRRLVVIPTRWLLLSMIVAIAAIGVLAFMNEQRRSEAELADLAREQAAVAEAATPRLAAGTLGDLEKAGTTRVLVLDDHRSAHLLDGTAVDEPAIVEAAKRGDRTARIDRSLAPRLGLPGRTAMAG